MRLCSWSTLNSRFNWTYTASNSLISLGTGFAFNGTPYAYVGLGLCMLRFDLKNTNGFTGRKTIGTIAKGYRPPNQLMVGYVCNDSVNSNVTWVLPGFIDSGGGMTIDNFRGSTIKEVQFTMTYKVA